MSPTPVPESVPADAAPEGNSETATETDKLTSCLGCRKRKLKCSRDVPSCTHCQRLDVNCVYDTKKSKPGLRPGAIEALSQRIEALENALAARQDAAAAPSVVASRSSSSGIPAGPEINHGVVNILAILAQELQKINTTAAAAPTTAPVPAANVLGGTIASSPSTTGSPITSTNGVGWQPRKRRRRIDSCGNPNIDLARPLEDLVDHDPALSPGLPPPEVLQAIVNAYFLMVQPWIPVLHETQFRRRMHDADQRPQLTCILHAMVVAAARYVPDVHDIDSSVDHDMLRRFAQRSRGHVLLHAIDSLSVENLQALIIIAFHNIGSGYASQAWSIVASLTRTVEYLNLATEDEDHQTYHDQNQDYSGGSSSSSTHRPLLRPLTVLGPPRNWIEEEERRRVFWCIFLLDRFCSVATGWPTGLTASGMHRRLPADGFFFHKEEPVLTPYMYPPSGPPDTHAPGATAREVADSPESTHSLAYGHQGPHAGNMANIGAFAYCIEASEALSRVTTYFLLQSVDFANRQDVSRWLTRFKELDLRLVHWKMYLPQRWKDSNVSRQPALVNMDPNLTLAHITHNTSTILLHQRIAYPDPAWTRIVQLPSFCSAETCQNAAVETAAITSKYLRYTDHDSPVASQFAFCVYISARVLLVHWRYESVDRPSHANANASAAHVPDIMPEFWSLLRSLEDMDRRWLGARTSAGRDDKSLAGYYAQHLKDMHRQCLASPTYTVDVLGYTAFAPATQRTSWQVDAAAVPPAVPSAVPPSEAGPEARPPAPPPQRQPNQQPQQPQPQQPQQTQWHMQPLDQLSPTMTVYQQQAVASPSVYAAAAAASVVGVPTGAVMPSDDLAAISHLLLDQQFMDRDRVISFEDSFFAAPGRWT